MKVFISQPMQNRTNEEIETTYKRAAEDIRRRIRPDVHIEFLNTRNYRPPYELRKGRNERMVYWSHALQVLSMADAIYLCPGWQNAAGCTVEANVAKLCGLPMIEAEAI